MGTLDSQKVNSDVITNNHLKAYKQILELTNAHLAGYEPGGDIQISRGAKYAKVISKLFPQTRLRVHCGNTGHRDSDCHHYMMAATVMYYSPSRLSAFSRVQKLAAATKSKAKHDIKSWLLKHDS